MNPCPLRAVPVAPAKRIDTRVGLMNPGFVYVPASQTDIRKTFERIKAQLKAKS